MQSLPRYERGWMSIDGIAADRMSQVTHVDADLVGSAGFQPEAEQGRITISF